MYRIVDMSNVVGIVLAGGEGSRADPLTRFRSKTAIPIGGMFRLGDIMLSNLLHSEITRIFFVVQKRPKSLMEHLEGFRDAVAPMRGEFIRCLSPPKEEERFYESDLDSLCHHLPLTWYDLDAEYILLVMGDQVVKVDYRQVLLALLEEKADALMVYRRTPLEDAAGRLGVIQTDQGDRVVHMAEKPDVPIAIDGDPARCRANLAMYLIKKGCFVEMLNDARRNHSPHLTLSQVGIPWLYQHATVIAYDLNDNVVPGVSEYERNAFYEVGTPDDYVDAQRAFCQRDPQFNLYSTQWKILTVPRWPMNAAKIDRVVMEEALIAPNVICQDDSCVIRSVIHYGVVVGCGSKIIDSVLLDGARIGPGSVIEHAVIEKDLVVPGGMTIAPDSLPNGSDGVVVTSQGRVFLPKRLLFS